MSFLSNSIFPEIPLVGKDEDYKIRYKKHYGKKGSNFSFLLFRCGGLLRILLSLFDLDVLKYGYFEDFLTKNESFCKIQFILFRNPLTREGLKYRKKGEKHF